jgi:hypothetical protein
MTSSTLYVHLEVLYFCRKTWTKGTESQQVRRSRSGVLFVFKCMVKSLPKVERTKVLQSNILEPLSWTRVWRRQNDVINRVQVQIGKKTHMDERATKPGWNGPRPAARPIATSLRPPIFWAWRRCNTKHVWAPPFAERESHSPERSSTS